MDGRQQASVSLFMNGWRRALHIPRVAFEHPISIISRLFRAPDQIIQPWMFGHGETKATCLWTRNLPQLEPTNIVEGREPLVHHMPPSPDRWKKRAETKQGIADAMADQWGSLLTQQVAA
jgi:hypothetical protein